MRDNKDTEGAIMGTIFELVQDEEKGANAVIKVIGIGSGGVNAINHLVDQGVGGVDYIVMNTDAQDLRKSKASEKIVLDGPTRGNGAGGDPAKGREAAIQAKHRIEQVLKGADMVVLATGFGGGTGTGATPVVGDVARSMGILTVAVVTLPFAWDGGNKHAIAADGIEVLKEAVDAYVQIPNAKVLKVIPKKASTMEAMAVMDGVLADAIKGIVDLVTRPGLINRDIEDVRSVLKDCGLCLMGTGVGTGEERAEMALKNALNNPLLEDTPIDGAMSVLYNVIQGINNSMWELDFIGTQIKEKLPKNASITSGVVIDESIGDKVIITIIASGIEKIEDVGKDVTVEWSKDDGFSSNSPTSVNMGTKPTFADPDDYLRPRSSKSDNGTTEINETQLFYDVEGESELSTTPAFLRVGTSKSLQTRRPSWLNDGSDKDF